MFSVHVMCPNAQCECQKQITFTPKLVQLERAGFKNTMRRIFKGNRKAWYNFLKPAVKTVAPVIGMAIGGKSKNPQIGQATIF